MKRSFIAKITIFFFLCLIEQKVIYAQSIDYDSLRCIDVRFDILNYELSLYNVKYVFQTIDGDTVIINKKCNYETTGISYIQPEILISTLIGFKVDSIYSITLQPIEIECNDDNLWYYCFVKFNFSHPITFDPNTFNKNEATKKGIFFNVGDNKVDMNNQLFLLLYAFPRHFPPDYLLPEKIYPLYIKNKKGEYKPNKKYKGTRGEYSRIIMLDEYGTFTFVDIPIPKITKKNLKHK